MQLTVNGETIHYLRSGIKGAPSVILGHSLGCSAKMWDPQMTVLESEFDCVRIDMRGHGESSTPAGPYSLSDLAGDVIHVMDALDIDKAHWIGLSIGGMYGQALLLEHGDRFTSAILADTMSAIDPSTLPVWDERVSMVEQNGMAAIVDATIERWFTPSFVAANSQALQAVRSQVLATDPQGYIACCRAIQRLDYSDRLGEIGHRIAVIVGAEDMATPVAASEAIQARIADATLHVIDDASHLCNVEQSDRFNDIITGFLRSQ